MKPFSSNKTVTVNITTDTLLRTVALLVGIALLYYLIDNVGHQLRLIAVSAFLALALNPAVTWLAKRLRSKSRTLATGVAYLVVIGALGLFVAFVVPPLVRQTANFARDVPKTIQEFQARDTALSRAVERYDLGEKLREVGDDISSRVGDFSGPLISTAGRVGGILVSIITVLVLTFMMLVEGPLWLRRISELQPSAKKEKSTRVIKRMYRVVTGYVNGQVLIAALGAFFTAVALFIGSTIADVSVNPIALAGIVFLFNLIPLIGSTLGGSIVVLVSVFSSVGLAVGMAVFFLIYQQIENITLQPYIQSRNNQLTPLIVFVAAIVGAGIGGILGAFAAIPVAGCLKILVEEYVLDNLPTSETVEKASV